MYCVIQLALKYWRKEKVQYDSQVLINIIQFTKSILID